MTFDSFVKIISSVKEIELLGDCSHKKVVPKSRPHFSEDEIIELKPKISSVLILFFQRENKPKFVLIERNKYNGFHSGQISLVGGKKDELDETLENTAIRESVEEIGIEANDVNIVSPLSRVYVIPSNFLIYPFVGYLKNKEISFTKNDREVNQILEVSLSDLQDDNNLKMRRLKVFYSKSKIKSPCFIFDNKIVWGATAMILQEFKDIFNSARDCATLKYLL